MRNSKLKPFSVSHRGLISGELFKANDIFDLINNRLPKRVSDTWETISFIDSENRSITVTWDFIEQGLTIDEVIEDWISNGDTNEEITAMNTKSNNWKKPTVILHEFTIEEL